MSCRKEDEIGCCCECEHQLKIHVCSCGQCSTVTGYICIMFHVADHSYLCTHFPDKHGLCEMFLKRKKEKKTPEINLVKKLNEKLNQRAE